MSQIMSSRRRCQYGPGCTGQAHYPPCPHVPVAPAVMARPDDISAEGRRKLACPACGYGCGCCCHCDCQTPCDDPDPDGECDCRPPCHGGHPNAECHNWSVRGLQR